jgi:hypothetical protein
MLHIPRFIYNSVSYVNNLSGFKFKIEFIDVILSLAFTYALDP